MRAKVPLTELKRRLDSFRAEMDRTDREWKLVLIISKINLYYFTGTMQEGMLFIPRNGEAVYYVRKSYDRAMEESNFPAIRQIISFSEVVAENPYIPEICHVETEFLPIAFYRRLQKYFRFSDVKSADRQIGAVRAKKSPYELSLMEQSGEIHRHIMEECIPEMLKEGISEAELAADVYALAVKKGHHGVSRFAMFDTEMVLGQISFGVNSIYPTSFNGPGGNYGLSPAVPSFGSREKKLAPGDLVFIDIGMGVEGYHTDKTLTYVFGKQLPKEAVEAHRQCLHIQDMAAEMLKPGVLPEDIYRTVMNSLDPQFAINFMGYGKSTVRFLGHGIGLTVDEYPVIAEGFAEPLQEGMVIALEPKKGIEGIGMVGIENTFLVTPEGGKCLTGTSPGLVLV